MNSLLSVESFLAAGKNQVGGKALCLAKMAECGIRIPKTFCIPCRVFRDYLDQTRLRDRILFEINHKSFELMRWEEIWDIALRIRHLFLTTPLPLDIHNDLTRLINRHCIGRPFAVRSSAPGEDGSKTSFAGLHDSFLNISGVSEILKHVRLVWASLYSDAALLYRKELGLDIHTSQMAVILQELIPSDRSGILFGLNPTDSNQAVVEAVWGLNQSLVDGDVEPDRWILNRYSGKIGQHVTPVRERYAIPDRSGISLRDLDADSALNAPLRDDEVFQVWETGRQLENLFGRPQDMEWTYSNDQLIVLQARPITTTGFNPSDDKRSWYLSLHRSYENLKTLYDKIENRLIPEMIAKADHLGKIDLEGMTTQALCHEIEDRQRIYDHWVKVYWADFIPFAHGIRLFGQVYNDAVSPEDPYEFMTLLEDTGLKSVERNNRLEHLAEIIRNDKKLKAQLENDLLPGPEHPFRLALTEFIDRFGDLSCTTGNSSECHQGEAGVIRLLLEFSSRPARTKEPNQYRSNELKNAYFQHFPPDQLDFATEVLELGRESYRLRDDDNIHLGRLEARLSEAIQEGQRRLDAGISSNEEIDLLSKIPALGLKSGNSIEKKIDSQDQADDSAEERWFKTRQIVGHPAGPGIASGKARLIRDPQDLLSFKKDEILVCQGVDPNMTFVVPIAAAVVEERGGMLIHGAIIAREYGLPCVTGAAGAMKRIEDGNQITVDGYLGMVTCQTEDL